MSERTTTNDETLEESRTRKFPLPYVTDMKVTLGIELLRAQVTAGADPRLDEVGILLADMNAELTHLRAKKAEQRRVVDALVTLDQIMSRWGMASRFLWRLLAPRKGERLTVEGTAAMVPFLTK